MYRRKLVISIWLIAIKIKSNTFNKEWSERRKPTGWGQLKSIISANGFKKWRKLSISSSLTIIKSVEWAENKIGICLARHHAFWILSVHYAEL